MKDLSKKKAHHREETTAEDLAAAVFMGVKFPKRAADFDRDRTTANFILVNILAQYLVDHPSERFGQALRNLGIVSEREVVINEGGGRESLELIWENEFMTEPHAMVARAKAVLARTK